MTVLEKAVTFEIPPPQINLFEDVLEILGGFGRFQVLVLVLLLILEIPTAFVTFITVFVGGRVTGEWKCGNELINFSDVCLCNQTLESLSSKDSIVTEWSLICDRAWVSDFITSVQMVGMFFGNLYGSQFADWYGRRAGFLASILLLILGSAVSAVAPNPYVYGAARLLCGAGIPAFINITCMAVIEFMPPKWRSLSNSVGPTGEGIMILSILAYFIRPWRILHWATLAPFALIVVIYPFVPESPRWLLRNGRVDEAHKTLRYMAKVNGSQVVDIEVLQRISEKEKLESEALGAQRFTYWQFIKDKKLRRTSFYMMAVWFTWSFTYFGITYNIKNVEGNIYLYVFLIGLANALGQRAAMLINDRLGRRRSLFVSMTCCAAFLVTLAICVLVLPEEKLRWVVVTFCLLGQFCMASARSSARLLSGESFPTPVRTMGLGLSGFASNFAGVATPILAYIGSQWPAVPFFLFAVVSVGGSLVCFLMAETMGKPLTDGMTDESTKKASHKIKSAKSADDDQQISEKL